MELRKFGCTGFLVSPIVYGTWEIGGCPFFTDISNKDAVNLIKRSYDLGINFFDTAPLYGFGRSEELLGKAVKKFRNKIYISTKCGLRWKERKIKSIYRNLTNKSVFEEIDLSLKRLDTDYIDLYLIHWYDNETNAPMTETIEALEKIKKDGKIRYYGVSNFTLENLNEVRENKGTVSGLQSNYNMLRRDIEGKELKYCTDNNIGFQAYSPLHRGVLTDYTVDSLKNKKSKAIEHILKTLNEKELLKLNEIKKISEKYNTSFAQFVINWTINMPAVTTAIIGTTKIKHIEEAVKSYDININEDDKNEIIRILDEK